MTTRPPGRAELVGLLERHGLAPSRALGQNFLADPNLAEHIARLSGAGEGDRVLEIGPGLGSLTLALVATGARVLALEKDRRLLPVLGELDAGDRLEVVEGDAMSCDWERLLGRGSWTMVSNLPYNVATPVVIDLLVSAPQVAKMLVMVQREVGERLCAPPSTPAYGAVSAKVAYFATARLVGRVPPSVFVPRPQVASALVELLRRPEPAVSVETATYEEIDRLLRLAFATRRKMLRRSLVGAVSPDDFARAGIDPSRRPEECSIAEWGRLAGAVAGRELPTDETEPSAP